MQQFIKDGVPPNPKPKPSDEKSDKAGAIATVFLAICVCSTIYFGEKYCPNKGGSGGGRDRSFSNGSIGGWSAGSGGGYSAGSGGGDSW